MHNKTAQNYYDAIISGNSEEAERLKSDMNEQVKTAQKNTSISPMVVNTLLGDDSVPAIHVYNFLNEKFGDDWYNWEVETIDRMLWVEFGLVLSEVNRDKIQAIKYLLNSQRPFLDWWYFNQLACSFCGSIADFTSIKSPSPGMAIATTKAMRAIRPEEDFSRNVKKYICLVMIDAGIYCPPVSLFDMLKEEFEVLISKDSVAMWPSIIKKASEMINDKEYGQEDEAVCIQARRLLVAEHAANKFGG